MSIWRLGDLGMFEIVCDLIDLIRMGFDVVQV